jgi:hypothetical protein
MIKNEYFLEGFNSKIDDETGIEIFTINNLTSKINDSPSIYLDGKYFAVKYGMSYGHLLLDGIGQYLYLKIKNPDLKIVFFKFGNNEYNKVCENLINFFNAEVINVFNNNYKIKNLIFFYIEDARLELPKDIVDNKNTNLFIPPIPSKLFLNYYYVVPEWSNEWTSLKIKSIESLCKTFYPYRIKNNKDKIYVSRLNDTTRIDNYSKSNWFKKIRERSKIYDDNLDEIMKNKGYKVVYPEQLDFFEQINLFYNATDIVTIDGTSVLNSIWSDSKTNITRIMINKEYKKLNYNWSIFILASGDKNIKVLDLTNLDPIVGLKRITKNIN